jgi:hypothetical protein
LVAAPRMSRRRPQVKPNPGLRELSAIELRPGESPKRVRTRQILVEGLGRLLLVALDPIAIAVGHVRARVADAVTDAFETKAASCMIET